MDSLILELQRDVIDPSISVLSLLRKALIVAKKLGIQEFENWIELELNGYTEAKSVPKYRFIQGQLRGWNPFHGWQPIIAGDTEILELYKAVCNRPIIQPISELIALIENTSSNKELQIALSPEVESFLIGSTGADVPVKLRISSASIQKIVDAAKDIILRWALQLENDGILGEGITFSQQEKAIASNQNYHIFIENNLGDKSMSNIQNNNFSGATVGGGVAGRNYTGNVIHTYAAEQNLLKAAEQIQQILKQLEQSYPTTSLVEKATVAEKAIKQIESNPTLKARVLGALKSAGKEAFKEAVDHPLVNVLMAGIEGWQEGV